MAQLRFDDLKQITRNFNSGCCGSDIEIRVDDGRYAILVCTGNGQGSTHVLDNSALIEKDEQA